MGNRWGNRETVSDFIFWAPKSLQMVTAAMKLRRLLLGRKVMTNLDQIRSDQSLSRVLRFVTPGTAAHQASLSITNSWSLLRLLSIEPVMASNHLILCRPLLLLPPIPLSIRVFSNESTLCMSWPKYLEFQLQHQSFQ